MYIYTIINKLFIYSSIEFCFLIFRSHPQFSSDFRNVRLALASDGFSPYGSTAVPYSAWPVIAMPYNLPPSLCMKKEFNMLVMLISGPKSPGKCLNVFMRPMIEELKMLWETGVPTWVNVFRLI